MNQPQAQFNATQQGQNWCEICVGSVHFEELCGSNLKSVNFVDNAQNKIQDYDNAYNHNRQI